MTIRLRIKELMNEAHAIPMDLIRFGLAQGTSYNLARENIKMMDLATLDTLCDFFSQRLERPITPGDILVHEPNKGKS